jgi:hypothetical protein
LLPLLYAPNSHKMFAAYGHSEYVHAIADFCAQLPGGRQDYRDAVQLFARHVYDRATKGGAIYFLDKTPRYHLIAREIMRTFPDGKFVFLWRHPLATPASMMETWADGRWNLHRYNVDLFDGLAELCEVFRGNAERACALRYEDLVRDPGGQARRLFEYLGLEHDPSAADEFASVRLGGRMGDPKGTLAYSSVDNEPLGKWRRVLNNPIRKAWARRYIEWIGHDRLADMGYSLEAIRLELEQIPTSISRIGSDAIRLCVGPIYTVARPSWVVRFGPRKQR